MKDISFSNASPGDLLRFTPGDSNTYFMIIGFQDLVNYGHYFDVSMKLWNLNERCISYMSFVVKDGQVGWPQPPNYSNGFLPFPGKIYERYPLL